MARFCNKCNYPIEEGGAFCTECGSSDIRDEFAPKKAKPKAPPTTSVPLVQMTTTPTTEPANVGVQPQGSPIGVQPVSNSTSEGETNSLTIPSVTLPTVGTLQTNTEDTTPKSSFADVPDFMSGDGIASNSTTPVKVPKDFHLQEGGSANDYGSNVNPALLNRAAKKKKKNNNLLVTILVIAALLIGALLLLFVYYYGQEMGKQSPGGPFTTDTVGDGGDNQDFDFSTMFTTENSFRVGNASFGYISIPNTWAKFKDVEGNNTLQYTDDGSWIVTIYAMPTTSISAKDWANSVYNTVVANGAENVLASTSKIDKYTALTVTAYYPVQGKYLTTWFFESDSGKTHYLAIEGPQPEGNPYYCIYSFTEDH